MIIKKDNEKINLSKLLYYENIEQINKLKNRAYEISEKLEDVSSNKHLLTAEEEFVLLHKLNQLKTIIFYDLIMSEKIYNEFLKMINDFIKQNQLATKKEDEDEEYDKQELNDYFYMTYADEDKNKKRISYELKNKLLKQDLKKIISTREKLYKKLIDGNLEYKEYKKIIEDNIKIINNINPTTKFYKKMLSMLKEDKNKENFIDDEYINTIEFLIRNIRELLDILTRFNIRLIITIVKQYIGKVKTNTNLKFEDLKNEGVLGFIKAVYKFNPFKELKLSTYVTYWIMQHIIQYINNNRNIITVPLYYTKQIGEYEKTKQKLISMGKEATDEEIAKEMGISLKKLQSAKEYIKNRSYFSIIQKDDENDDYSIEDMVSTQKDLEDTETEIINSELADIIKYEIQNSLNTKERYILESRLEGMTRQPKKLEELAKELDLTRERIRQLEKEGLNKLKRILNEKYGIKY